MSKTLLKALAVVASVPAAVLPDIGFAGTCDVPVIDWQSREALRALLEAAGWHIRAITIRDGCYAVATSDDTRDGADVLFDPRTLKKVENEE